jgi:hypothetical protein
VHHGLLVLGLIEAEALAGSLFDDTLAQAGHIAVAENAPNAFDEAVLDAVAFDVLAGQEPHDRLAGR